MYMHLAMQVLSLYHLMYKIISNLQCAKKKASYILDVIFALFILILSKGFSRNCPQEGVGSIFFLDPPPSGQKNNCGPPPSGRIVFHVPPPSGHFLAKFDKYFKKFCTKNIFLWYKSYSRGMLHCVQIWEQSKD